MGKIATQFSTTFHPKIAPEYHYLFTDIQILEKNLALAPIFYRNLYVSVVIMTYGVKPYINHYHIYLSIYFYVFIVFYRYLAIQLSFF